MLLSFVKTPPCSLLTGAASPRGGEKGWPRGLGLPILTPLGYGAGLSLVAGPLTGSQGDFSLSGRTWPSLGRCFQLWLKVSCLDSALDMMFSLPGACSGVRSQHSTCLVFNVAGLLPGFIPYFPRSVLGLVLGLPPWAARVLPEQGGQGAGWQQPFCPGGPASLALGGLTLDLALGRWSGSGKAFPSPAREVWCNAWLGAAPSIGAVAG